jgi:hypothetical protein
VAGYALLALLLAGNVKAQATTSAATTTAATTTAAAATTSQTSATPQTTSTAATAVTTRTSSQSTLPALGTSATKDSLPSLVTAKLPGITQTNVPSYQVVIPNIADNPFLQKSNYPDGTVFIIVGSRLAGLALIVIGWRAAYIWCLHRQTKEHRKQQKFSEMGEQRPFTAVNGTTFNGGISNNPFTRDISMEYLRPGDRRSQTSVFSRPSTGKTATNTTRPLSTADPIIPSNGQYYSPSAHPGGTAAAALGTQSAERNSSYLPAGYYLRDASSPANGSSATPTSPRQDQITGQLPRANRSSVSVVSINGGRTGSVYGVPPARPLSTGYPPSPSSFPQPRRTQTSHTDASAGDRRSKPSQVLDDLLGGRS